MTDNFPDKTGYIADGHTLAFCKCANVIALGEYVKFTTTITSGILNVGNQVYGTGIAMAMKAGNTNDIIPVALYGVVKTSMGASVVANRHVFAGTTAGIAIVIPSNAADAFVMDHNGPNTSSTTKYYMCLGVALQSSTTEADQGLILLGGTR